MEWITDRVAESFGWAWYDWAVFVVMGIVIVAGIAMLFAPTLAKHESNDKLPGEPCRDCGKTSEQLYRGRCLVCWMQLMSSLRFCSDCGKAWQPGEEDAAGKCPTCRRCAQPIKAIPAEVINSN